MISDILKKREVTRVVGVDSSSNGYAYAVIDRGNLVDYGFFEFKGEDYLSRLANAFLHALAISQMGGEICAVESAVYVNNRQVVIKLAYFIGLVLASSASNGASVHDVAPITWMSHIGNPNFKKGEKHLIHKKYGVEKSSKNKKKEAEREERKNRTRLIIEKKFGLDIDDDNVTDAIGVAIYAWEEIAGNEVL